MLGEAAQGLCVREHGNRRVIQNLGVVHSQETHQNWEVVRERGGCKMPVHGPSAVQELLEYIKAKD